MTPEMVWMPIIACALWFVIGLAIGSVVTNNRRDREQNND